MFRSIVCGAAASVPIAKRLFARRALSATAARPFWRTKTLAEMSAAEWESLCDRCGRCCVHQLEDEETGMVGVTDVACRLLDIDTARCKSYGARHATVPECVQLSAHTPVEELGFMPASCAYRKIANGQKLAWWHPLRSGDPQTVVAAGISVRGKLVSEESFDGDLEDRIVAFKKGSSARAARDARNRRANALWEDLKRPCGGDDGGDGGGTTQFEGSHEEWGDGIRVDVGALAELGVELDPENKGGMGSLMGLDEDQLRLLVDGDEAALTALKSHLDAIR